MRIAKLLLYLLIFACYQGVTSLSGQSCEIIDDWQGQNCKYPILIVFQARVAGGHYLYTWTINNQIYTEKSPLVSVPRASTVSVSVTVRDSITSQVVCQSSRTFSVEEPPPLTVVSDKNVACRVQESFNLRVTNPKLTKYFWAIPENTPPNRGNISVSFTSPGLKTIQVFAEDEKGCISPVLTLPNFLKVNVPVEVDIAANPMAGCAPVTINFLPRLTLNNNEIKSYNWHFSGGTPTSSSSATPSVVFQRPGKYDVSLTVTTTDNCNYTITKPQFIESADMPAVNPTISPLIVRNICPGQTFTLRNTTPNRSSLPGTFTWQGPLVSENGEEGTFRIMQPGVYKVVLLYTQTGCVRTGRDSATIHVLGQPHNLATLIPTERGLCKTPDTITLVLQGFNPNNRYTWRVRNQNRQLFPNPTFVRENQFSLIIPQNGQYDVAVFFTTPEGCTDSISYNQFIIAQRPQALFASANPGVCIGQRVSLKSTSKPEGVPFTTLWFYQRNGTTDQVYFGAGENIEFAPPELGTYAITLRISNFGNCQDELTRRDFITVNVLEANASATITNGCINPVLRVPLTISAKRNVFVGSNSRSLTAVWQSTPPEGVRFVPGVRSEEVIAEITRPGIYQLQGIATNSVGCTDRVSINVPIIAGIRSQIDLPPNVVCRNQSTRFFGKSTLSTPSTFLWNVTPLSNQTGEIRFFPNRNIPGPLITFPDSGKYRLCLRTTLTNATGSCSSDTCITVEVKRSYLQPNHFGAVDSVLFCQPKIVKFRFFKELSRVKPTEFIWEFGDGRIAASNADSISHIYTRNGYFNVKLTIKDSLGCPESATKPNYIFIKGPIPKFTLSEDSICGSLAKVTLTNQSRGAEGYILLRDLATAENQSFGENLIKINLDYRVPFTNILDSVKVVQLLLKALSGSCDDDYRDSITFFRPPNPDFEIITSAACPPMQVQFRNTSRYGVRWLWEIDGNTTSERRTPPPFTIIGSETRKQIPVKLRAWSLGECEAFVQKQIPIAYPPKIGFKTDTDNICPFQSVVLSDTSRGESNVVAWLWSTSDNQTSTNSIPTFQLKKPGQYSFSLTVTDANGCTAALTKENYVFVRDLGVTAEALVPPGGFPVFNYQQPVTFVAQSNPNVASITSWQWFFGDGNTNCCQNTTVTHTYRLRDEKILFKPYLVVKDINNCIDTVNLSPFVLEEFTMKIPNTFTPNQDGENDLFFIDYSGFLPVELKIFDRWGNSVFVATQNKQGWNGNLPNGEAAPAGTYFYALKIGSLLKQGSVTLIR